MDVIMASDGASLELLKKEFPGLPSLELPSYSIKYAKNGPLLKWALLKRIPKIIQSVKEEKKRVNDLVVLGRIQGIISDNRFGVFNELVPSVYITHQINVLSGKTTSITSKWHHNIIKQFDECWVPDNHGAKNLSGKLGHLDNKKIKLRYLGLISRMVKMDIPIQHDILFLLSGPEPQRSLLEEKILSEFKDLEKRMILIRGVVEPQQKRTRIGNINLVNFMLKDELEEYLNACSLVVSRPGYTTLLDLAALQKKAFFIPTPGQHEQLYLAKRMKELRMAPYSNQNEICIEQLGEVSKFNGMESDFEPLDHQELFSLFKGEREF
jgi:UDP-N-acetylglucosamine transferase subunit ALG13